MSDELKKRMDLVYREIVHRGLASKRKDLAPLLGYDVSYTSQLFNGKVEITSRISQRFFEKTGINPVFLETGKGDIYPPKAETIIIPDPPKPRDATLYREGETPLNDIDLSMGVKNVDYDELIMLLLLKKKEQLKQLINEVINEKGHE